MTLDHKDFIERHHKKTGARHGPGDGRDISSIMVFLILALYLVVMIFIVSVAQVGSTTIFISIFVFIAATLVAFAAKRAQYLQARQENELVLLKEVLEGSRGGRLITDSVDNTLYYNQKFIENCGKQEKYGYESLTAMFESNDKASALLDALSDKAHRGLTDSIELYCDLRNLEGWYQITAQPIAGHAGYIHWRIDNVTERYTAERAVREEREKLLDFTDNAPVGFFSVDEHGRFQFANATFSRWLGEDLGYLLAQGRLHTYLESPPEGAPPYQLTQEDSPSQIVELQMKGPAGRTFLASVNYGIMHMDDGTVRTRAVVHDLTAEREIRKALQASEDRFHRFFEEAPLGIILVNQDNRIEDCNSEFARMIGSSVSDIEGTDFRDLLADEERASVLSALGLTEKGRQTTGPMDVTLKGSRRPVSTELHARRFKEGRNIVLHFIDTTEKKALEEQFVQSQKMQAIGQLAGGVAHDFNNMLTAIIGFCDLLLLRHKPGDPSFGDIMQIKQNSNRAANLVRQLLAFSRQQTLRPRLHDLTDILTELSHLLRRLIGANIELDIVHGDDLRLVKIDEGQMEQVFINLAVNARDAMENGGTVTITTENYTNEKPREINNEDMPPGDWVLIKVSDTGTGISKENLARIFEPFFTTKEIGQGTGLGLSTVYGIVRQSGGFLDVESKIGQGTTFLIYLPRATEGEESEDDEEEQVVEEKPKDLTGTETILLVEDEDAVRTFSQRALTNKGYKVLSAESGDSALLLLEKTENTKLDLLITDVVMPGIDGPTLAKKIRQSSPKLKIIFISGYTEERLKDHMGERIYFLPKPFTLKQLAEKVKEVLEE
ncbi:MAG: PAS domain S-box protein [Rhodospirillales bacterium]|nr:PAS domain S-box protein [Rhodospirillales bacterium]